LTKLYGQPQGNVFLKQLPCAAIAQGNCMTDSCANFQIILLHTTYCGNIHKNHHMLFFFLIFQNYMIK
jgi:hypothetical protein